MIKELLGNIVRALFLIIFQVLILNNIGLGGYINPYLYILIILLLPLETPAWLTQIISFGVGITIDIIVETPGMHTSAMIFIGFIRPFLLKYSAPRDGYETDDEPNIKSLGLSWFFKYALILTSAHHLFLFQVESFNFTNIGHTLIRTVLSTIFTLSLILLTQYLRIGNSHKNKF
ncbi:MAG: rod shape-determining protein MreD [Salinivirgaceae bacterium]|jgi:hypothetical protein|nr:rod shape-determining protein MreD [Salinivirgaceae bacterium]MDD4745881.1 rod shape-determining protein MreD [Salinivirgaceae bacterium]MDY0278946.1 rod shape-determining protein MreD [Salinivirgaceae bacterium]